MDRLRVDEDRVSSLTHLVQPSTALAPQGGGGDWNVVPFGGKGHVIFLGGLGMMFGMGWDGIISSHVFLC